MDDLGGPPLFVETPIHLLICSPFSTYPVLVTVVPDQEFLMGCLRLRGQATAMDVGALGGGSDGNFRWVGAPFTYMYYLTVFFCVQPWDSWGLYIIHKYPRVIGLI